MQVSTIKKKKDKTRHGEALLHTQAPGMGANWPTPKFWAWGGTSPRLGRGADVEGTHFQPINVTANIGRLYLLRHNSDRDNTGLYRYLFEKRLSMVIKMSKSDGSLKDIAVSSFSYAKGQKRAWKCIPLQPRLRRGTTLTHAQAPGMGKHFSTPGNGF